MGANLAIVDLGSSFFVAQVHSIMENRCVLSTDARVKVGIIYTLHFKSITPITYGSAMTHNFGIADTTNNMCRRVLLCRHCWTTVFYFTNMNTFLASADSLQMHCAIEFCFIMAALL